MNDKFTWIDENNNKQIFKIRRARDEPISIKWENAVCEKEELEYAHKSVKTTLFFILVFCFLVLFFLIRFHDVMQT